MLNASEKVIIWWVDESSHTLVTHLQSKQRFAAFPYEFRGDPYTSRDGFPDARVGSLWSNYHYWCRSTLWFGFAGCSWSRYVPIHWMDFFSSNWDRTLFPWTCCIGSEAEASSRKVGRWSANSTKSLHCEPGLILPDQLTIRDTRKPLSVMVVLKVY